VDSWYNAIGSAAVTTVLGFCDSEDELVDSDENRVEFAKYHLENLRFLYRKADGDDNKKWKGTFRGAFVLQTFAVHLSAIDGSACVPNLHDEPSPNAVGALGVAAASVECVLKLIATVAHQDSTLVSSERGRWGGGTVRQCSNEVTTIRNETKRGRDFSLALNGQSKPHPGLDSSDGRKVRSDDRNDERKRGKR